MNRLLLIFSACLLGLAACGQSGDLYRPEDRPPPPADTAEPAQDETDDTAAEY